MKKNIILIILFIVIVVFANQHKIIKPKIEVSNRGIIGTSTIETIIHTSSTNWYADLVDYEYNEGEWRKEFERVTGKPLR